MSVESQRKDNKLGVIFRVQKFRLQEVTVLGILDIRTTKRCLSMTSNIPINSRTIERPRSSHLPLIRNHRE